MERGRESWKTFGQESWKWTGVVGDASGIRQRVSRTFRPSSRTARVYIFSGPLQPFSRDISRVTLPCYHQGFVYGRLAEGYPISSWIFLRSRPCRETAASVFPKQSCLSSCCGSGLWDGRYTLSWCLLMGELSCSVGVSRDMLPMYLTCSSHRGCCWTCTTWLLNTLLVFFPSDEAEELCLQLCTT